MADEIGELDLTAQASAAKTATNYMSFDSTNGLKIASSNPSNATRYVQISSNKIHIQNDSNNYSYIDSNGLTIYQGGNDVANFGSTARVGIDNSSRFLMNASNLQAYDDSNNKYFEVSANGISYGNNNTVATTAQLDEKADASDSIEYIVGTQTAATNAWTGITKETSLVAGKQISYYLPKAGNSSAATLNLTLNNGNGNTTGAKAIKMVYSTSSNTGSLSNVTTHYPVGSIINMTYDGTQWIISNYNTNVNTDTVANKYASSVIAGLNGIKRYTLCMKDSAGNWTSIVNQDNNATISGKTCYTGGLQLGKIMYHATNGNYAAGANSGEIWESRNTFDFRYSANGIALDNTSTLQLRKFVYLVGIIGNDGLFYLDTTNWWTQTPNNTTKTYVLIGAAHSANHANGGAYQVNLSDANPTFKYNGSELIEQIITNYMSFDSVNGLKIAQSEPSTATKLVQITPNNGILIKNDANNYAKIDSGGLAVFQGGAAVANFSGTNSQIGPSSGGHSIVSSTGMEVFTDTNTSVASFGATSRIGKASGESRMELDFHSLKLVDKEGAEYFYVSDLRDSNGWATITETFYPETTTHSCSTQFSIRSFETTSATVNGVAVELANVVGSSVTLSSNVAAGSIIVITYQTNSSNTKAYTFGKRNDNTNNFIGAFSIAEGYNVIASGNYSHAEGFNTEARDHYSHAEGFNTVANNRFSHAEGYNTRANGISSHAEGFHTMADNQYSHAEGYDTIANGRESHAEGYNTIANGNYSHAEGFNTMTNGESSHTEGFGTRALGNYSHAEGFYTIANANSSHAEGYNTIANGNYSHAEGFNTIANGLESHAEGYYTIANGLESHAEGGSTIASGSYSHAQNRRTKAASDSQTAIGKYNIGDTLDTYALIIGNGSADNDRSNAATIAWNGNYMAQAMAGIIQMFAGPSTNVPTGWLLCDGSYVSKTTYSTLFEAIGYTWGAESSVPTGYFALPDFRGREPKGPVTGNDRTASPNVICTGYQNTYVPDNYLGCTWSASITTSTTYTIQLWDVDVLHSGKNESTIGISVYWGGGTVLLASWIGTTKQERTSNNSLTSTTGTWFTVKEDHDSSNSIMYHADYLEAIVNSGTTAGADNYVNIYNSVPDASGNKWMHIGKIQIKQGSHAGDPYEPYPQYRNYSLGSYGGNDFYCLDTSHLPSHTHGISHQHGFGFASGQSIMTANAGISEHKVKSGSDSSNYYLSIGKGGDVQTSGKTATTTITTSTSGPTGDGRAPDNNAPYATVNFIICTGKTS